jgi:hypothetical protein
MKRQLILALAIFALAGCSAPRAPAGAAADAPANADTDISTATEPAPAPTPDDTQPAIDTVVPAAFLGEWAADAAACARPGDESRLRIDADRIAFHESSGAIVSVAGDAADLTLVAQLTGEGETREATYRFRLSGDGNTLTDTSSGRPGMVRQRCH